MTNNLKLILSTFNRQQHQNDCGLACLSSIFNYAGIANPQKITENNSSISLLELHKIAAQNGLISRCVRMDLQSLRDNASPCILHIRNNEGLPHFIVHYPGNFEGDLHLIGDPDRKIEFINEDLLLDKWESRAALFFENINPRNDIAHWFFPWNNLIQFRFIPKIVWVAVPFLNVAAAMLGLAVSLIIQKAVNPGFLDSKRSFFILLFILLVLISVAKCAVNYLREWMMIRFGSKMDSKLSSIFLSNLHDAYISSGNYQARNCFRALGDIQKIHQATAVMIGVVLSDGLLVMVMFSCLYFYHPAYIFLEIATFLAMLLVIDKYLPLLLIHYGTEQSPAILLAIQNNGESKSEDGLAFPSFVARCSKLNEMFIHKTRSVSGIANKINLLFEAITTTNIILVLIMSICQLRANLISYEQFLMTLILCYGMGLLMAKICNQLFIIAQAADMLRQNSPLAMTE
jgi:ATP-binding cassette subfamily B protein